VMDPDDLDMAGFAVGVVEEEERLGPHLVRPGDVLLGIASPGLRSNGYSLARHVLLERSSLELGGPAWPGAAHSLADELLRPSEIYAPAVLAAVAAGAGSGGVHACAHVTGGGLPGNLVRVLGRDCDAVIERGSWDVPPIFDEIARRGEVPAGEMERVFNLGLGMVLVVAPDAVEAVTRALADNGRPPAVVGAVRAGSGEVQLQ
jgi:phosphoribosylformylglycinamidine cyclo-ligase